MQPLPPGPTYDKRGMYLRAALHSQSGLDNAAHVPPARYRAPRSIQHRVRLPLAGQAPTHAVHALWRVRCMSRFFLMVAVRGRATEGPPGCDAVMASAKLD